MKIKIVQPNPEPWWYNSYIGCEFEVKRFSHYKGGTHTLTISNSEEFWRAMNTYGNISIHVDPPSNLGYSGECQIYWQHTDLNVRYMRFEKLKKLYVKIR